VARQATKPAAQIAEAKAKSAEQKLIACSRCGEPSEQSMCDTCQEAFSVLHELSSFGDQGFGVGVTVT
jgi:hypothetical protein